jgi:hypothetical protein
MSTGLAIVDASIRVVKPKPNGFDDIAHLVTFNPFVAKYQQRQNKSFTFWKRDFRMACH